MKYSLNESMQISIKDKRYNMLDILEIELNRQSIVLKIM